MFNTKLAYFLQIGALLVFIVITIISRFGDKIPKSDYSFVLMENPEISGWVAWWKEDEGMDLINRHNSQISSISPFCFIVNDSLEVENKCKKLLNKDVVLQYKDAGIKVIPTLGSDIRYEQWTPLLTNDTGIKQLAEYLSTQIADIGADGIDLDIEGIEESDRDRFTRMVEIFNDVFSSRGQHLSVTIHAQDGKNFYKITKGQDIRAIGRLADEVRIMAYDQHGTFSGPGPITSLNWLKDTVNYNLSLIPRDKLVIGLPSYGYIWEQTGYSKGYLYSEFMDYLNKSTEKYYVDRDSSSKELVYKTSLYEGWLSDAFSVIAKINTVRFLGVNRFVIWNLSGIDERLFDHNWTFPDNG